MRFLDRLTIIKEGIGIALDAIRSNKVRAALTIMGVAVGVFVVTAMAAAVHGIRASFQGDVDAFGATSFQVRRRGIQLGGCDGTDDTCPDRRNPPLTLSEAAAIRRLPSVQAVTGLVERVATGSAIAIATCRMSATTRSAPSGSRRTPATSYPAATSRRSKNNAAARVAIINDSLPEQLFADGDPIGKQIQIGSQPFTVIGVYHTKAGFLKTMDGRGPDRPRAHRSVLHGPATPRHVGSWRPI